MDGHKDRSPVTRLAVVDFGRRRRWTEAEKLRIVAESMAGRRQVSATARRHGISRAQLHAWRRQALAGRLIGGGDLEEALVPRFAPVSIATDAAPPMPAAGVADGIEPSRIEPSRIEPSRIEPSRIEIVLAGGRRLIVSETVNAPALARIITAVERA